MTKLNQNPITDVDLLAGIASKDKSAFGILYDRYSQLVYNLGNKIVKDHDYAGEVLQSVFVQIWNKAETYNRNKGAVSTWIINITRNKSIDILRRTKKHKLNVDLDLDNLESDTNYDFSISERAEQRDIILKAMDSISPDQKKIIELIYFEGYTHKEASEILNIPLGTAKTRVHLGIAKLRDKLTPFIIEN
jgi:RNA polymerase sigma-70 factor (ECF subfamily)